MPPISLDDLASTFETSKAKIKNNKKMINYPDGSSYLGNLSNDKYHGYGEYTHPNGVIYKGFFTNGEASGLGTIFYKDGSSYTGQWKNNYKHGKGEFNGNPSYKGDFKRGLRDGQGE